MGTFRRVPEDCQVRIMELLLFPFVMRKMEKLSQTRKGNGDPERVPEMERGGEWRQVDPNKVWSLVHSQARMSVSSFDR